MAAIPIAPGRKMKTQEGVSIGKPRKVAMGLPGLARAVSLLKTQNSKYTCLKLGGGKLSRTDNLEMGNIEN